MSKTKQQINIVLHMPEDKAAFEKVFVDASINAIYQLAQTSKKKATTEKQTNADEVPP